MQCFYSRCIFSQKEDILVYAIIPSPLVPPDAIRKLPLHIPWCTWLMLFLVRGGQVGGRGDDNVPWTCTHACYGAGISGGRFLQLVHMCDKVSVNNNTSWSCTHGWCYVGQGKGLVSGQGVITFFQLIHVCATVLVGRWPSLNLHYMCDTVSVDDEVSWLCTRGWCFAQGKKGVGGGSWSLCSCVMRCRRRITYILPFLAYLCNHFLDQCCG